MCISIPLPSGQGKSRSDRAGHSQPNAGTPKGCSSDDNWEPRTSTCWRQDRAWYLSLIWSRNFCAFKMDLSASGDLIAVKPSSGIWGSSKQSELTVRASPCASCRNCSGEPLSQSWALLLIPASALRRRQNPSWFICPSPGVSSG